MTTIANTSSVLLIGESGAGKTHYGAQLLKRLMKGDGRLRMKGAATNLEPYSAAMESLDDGLAAAHTATGTYVESIWPVADAAGNLTELCWPDYGGEQVKAIIDKRQITTVWANRVAAASAWILLIRLHQVHQRDDVFSKPLAELKRAAMPTEELRISDQARLIELLQMLVYIRGSRPDLALETPRLEILLSCWDEISGAGKPSELLRMHMPMLHDFITSNWAHPVVMGLSALERPLSPHTKDMEYATKGSEQFGYVVLGDGTRSADLTLPITELLSDGK